MSEKIGSLKISGLKCDNSTCDWRDDTISFEKYKEHINMACPKCGQNVLTFDDYMLAMQMIEAAKILDELSPEQIKELAGDNVTVEDIRNHPFLKDAKGIENITSIDQVVSISLNAHEKISVNEIKVIEETTEKII